MNAPNKKTKRKVKDSEQMVSLYIDKSLVERLKQIKKIKGISLRFQHEQALRDYIEKHETITEV